MVSNEANTFGSPVLTTNIGGIRYVIEINVNGYYFEGSEFVEFGTKISLNNSPVSERYKKLCYSSFEYYRDNHYWYNLDAKITKVVEDLLVVIINIAPTKLKTPL